VLGGIGRNNDHEKQKKAVNEIHKALVPGGKLFFAENLEGSTIHMFFRKNFVKWGHSWRYLKMEEVDDLFSCFPFVEYETKGFWGTFGRTENQRKMLGMIDNLTDSVIPAHKKYILIGVAIK
jgi:hypothetical protein